MRDQPSRRPAARSAADGEKAETQGNMVLAANLLEQSREGSRGQLHEPAADLRS